MNKKHVAILPAIALLGSLLSSCSKEFTQKDQLHTAELKGASVAELRGFADSQYNLLGFGYDLTGTYGSATSATYQVIDVARLSTEQPGRVEIIQTQGQDQQLISGINCENYSRNLSQQLQATDTLKLFSSTLKSAFHDSSSYSSKYVYSSYTIQLKQRTLKFTADNSVLRNYLSAAFQADILSGSPALLVSRYGTHVMSGILLGAKLNFLYQSQTRNADRSSAASAGLKVATGASFNVNVEGAANSSYSSTNSFQRLYYQAVGGDPTKGLLGIIDLNGAVSPKIDITAWQNSATLANSELIDINRNGLIPIYDLIADPAKSAAVKAYVIQYLIDHQIKTSTDPVRMYYNGLLNHHTMTIDPNDYDYAGYNWTDIGIGFHAFTSQVNGALPVYEYISTESGDHVFTINRNEYPYEQHHFMLMGIKFYAFLTQVPGSLPVHSFYRANMSNHTYTIDRYNYPYEQDGYIYQGISFYAFKYPVAR